MPERKSPKRTISASGGPGPLQMVDTRQYARKDVGPKGGGLSGNVLAFSGSIIYLHGINCITIR